MNKIDPIDLAMIILLFVQAAINFISCYRINRLENKLSVEKRKNLKKAADIGLNNARLNYEIIKSKSGERPITSDK